MVDGGKLEGCKICNQMLLWINKYFKMVIHFLNMLLGIITKTKSFFLLFLENHETSFYCLRSRINHKTSSDKAFKALLIMCQLNSSHTSYVDTTFWTKCVNVCRSQDLPSVDLFFLKYLNICLIGNNFVPVLLTRINISVHSAMKLSSSKFLFELFMILFSSSGA